MSIVKIEDLSPGDVFVKDNFTYYKEPNLLFHVQTEFMCTKPYGIPRKSEYCKTDEQRSFIQLPLFNNELTRKLIILDEVFKKYLGDTYVSFIKSGKNDYEDFVKIKFDSNTKISILKDNDYELINYKNIEQLKEQLKLFYYPVRFLICFKPWSYLNKKGVKIYATHIQGKSEGRHTIKPPESFI